MSKYTTEVRFICENSAGLSESEGANNVDSILDKCWNKVFNFDFPIFDENYRQILCRKILKHYYTREIAHETVGRWKLALNAKLNEIMPYYNQLYKSELLEFNPFYDVDLTRSREGSGTSNKTSNNTEINSGTSKNVSSGSGTSNTDTLNRFSDTPQNSMDTQGINDSVPLTTVTKVNEDNTTTNESTDTLTRNDNKTGSGTENINNTDKYIETVKGKQGTENYSSLLKKFRETFLNIDMMIIEDCSDCFFTLW
nr:MAG TPA: Lower collar protein [Caudoviricetes sp.]